ncbi:hypothetical protein Mapa_007224 [Marchantia paleacea]|nr:hypothetical protein Mapa_007224 [Marchantia paleacea]
MMREGWRSVPSVWQADRSVVRGRWTAGAKCCACRSCPKSSSSQRRRNGLFMDVREPEPSSGEKRKLFHSLETLLHRSADSPRQTGVPPSEFPFERGKRCGVRRRPDLRPERAEVGLGRRNRLPTKTFRSRSQSSSVGGIVGLGERLSPPSTSDALWRNPDPDSPFGGGRR